MQSNNPSALSRSACKRPWPLLLIGLLAAAAAHSASAGLSLDDARRMARRDAPSVAAQSARISAAREEAARAGALPDPTLQLAIDNLTATGSNAFDVGADLMTMRRIGVRQAWPARSKRDAEREVAAARVDTLDLQSDYTGLEAERLSGEAWIAVWAAAAERRFLRELAAESDRAIEIAKAQLANGTGSATDALSAKMVRAELDNDLRRAQSEIEVARASLTRWLGEAASRDTDAMPAITKLRVPAEQLRSTIDRHAVLQVWQGRERTAAAGVRLAQADKRPDLGFGLAYGARSGRTDMVMFEVSVGLPLFSRNRQDRGIAASFAERDAIESDHEDARRAQAEILERQLATWSSLRDQHARFQKTLLPLARDRSAVALAGYANAEPLRPWIDARRDEIELERQSVQVEADLGRVWLALDTLLPRATLTESPQ